MSLETATNNEPRKSRKAPVFERLNAHAKRSFQLIDKRKLSVPVDLYQRDESDGKVAREIALHYDVVAFGALTVIERSDGALHVADGGTRLSAAMQRSDISNVPCVVFSGVTDKEAADTFLRINMNRRKLRVEQQQHSELYAGHELAKQADIIMASFAESDVQFDSLWVLRDCLKRAHAATMTICDLAPSFASNHHVTGRLLKGLVKLEDILQVQGSTLQSKVNQLKLRKHFANLDRIIGAAMPPRQASKRPKFIAQTIARALKIKITIKDE